MRVVPVNGQQQTPTDSEISLADEADQTRFYCGRHKYNVLPQHPVTKMEDHTDASTYCVHPITVLGVQSESPLAVSPDGQKMAFVTANHSIYILLWSKERQRYEIDHLLAGHHWEVKALTFHPK